VSAGGGRVYRYAEWRMIILWEHLGQG
jgi:hypothetical protein